MNSPKTPRARHSACRNGKIARLPHPVREELNRRLENGEVTEPILDWLNALPEVQEVLKAHFESRPISSGNLSEWRLGGYRDWLVVQQSLNLVRGLENLDSLDRKDFAHSLAAKLAQWAALQYAACAQELVGDEEDLERRWQRLRELCMDLSRFRRFEIFAENVALRRERLALDQTDAAYLKEKQFWEWLERPDIKEKVYPKGSRGITPETLREIEEALRIM